MYLVNVWGECLRIALMVLSKGQCLWLPEKNPDICMCNIVGSQTPLGKKDVLFRAVSSFQRVNFSCFVNLKMCIMYLNVTK